MGSENVVADEPAGGGADKDVGGEVLLAEDTGEAEPGGQGVDAELSPVDSETSSASTSSANPFNIAVPGPRISRESSGSGTVSKSVAAIATPSSL